MKHQEIYNRITRGGFSGRARITLEDVRTHHREIVESKNIATNAMTRIFETNVLGRTDFENLQPMKDLFGGIFLFADELTIDANTIYPPNQGVNRMVANAGQTAFSGAAGNSTRGNPNDVATIIDPANGQIKFVWDWSLENGNGTISAAGLTNSKAGDVGLYPDGLDSLLGVYGTMPRFQSSLLGVGYDLTRSARYPLFIKSDGNGVSVFVSGNSLTEQTVRFPFVRPCLIESPDVLDGDNYTVVSSRTATLSRSFTDSYFQIAHDANNYYIIERDASENTKVYVDVVSKTDMSVSSKTITIAGATMARPEVLYSAVNNGIVSGGYLYMISGADAKTFVKININNAADVTILTSSLTNNISLRQQPISGATGVILGANFFINGDFVYPVAKRAARNNETLTRISGDNMAMYKDSPMLFNMPSVDFAATYEYLTAGSCLYLPYLATCLNLQSPVVKNANKTMRVEYLLTSIGG